MAKTVVILGAGWAGLPLAHKLLKHTLPKVELSVILVSPNSHFFWNVAATRAIIPGKIPDDQMFLPIAPGFEKYKSTPGAFELVLGVAESIEEARGAVNVAVNEDQSRSILYDQLVIATGSRIASGLPLKPTGSHEHNIKEWTALKKKVGASNTVVIAGAGTTGVEVAGELAAHYGSKKHITLIASGTQILDSNKDMLPSVRATAVNDLRKLGVSIIYDTRVTKADESDKKTTLTLSNDKELTTECYLPLHGIKLNTTFVPDAWRDTQGNIELDGFLRVAGTKNIWAVGDVGNSEPKQLTVTDNQIIYLAGVLDAVLAETEIKGPYKPVGKTMVFLSLGTWYATGQIGRWRLFGLLVSYVKGRKLFVDSAEGYVSGKHLRHAAM